MTAAVSVLHVYQALFPGVRLPDEDTAAAAVREVADRLGHKVPVWPAWRGHLVVGERVADKLCRAEEARMAADQAVVDAAARAGAVLAPVHPDLALARAGYVDPRAAMAAKIEALTRAGATAGQVGEAIRRLAESM